MSLVNINIESNSFQDFSKTLTLISIFEIFIQYFNLENNSNVLNTKLIMCWGKTVIHLIRIRFEGWQILLISKIGLTILKFPINYTHP